MRGHRTADARGFGVLQFDFIATLEQRRSQGALACQEHLDIRMRLAHQAPAIAAAALVDLQKAAYRHVHYVSGKAQLVAAHPPQHAQLTGCKTARWLVPRKERSGRWINTRLRPAPQIEQEHQSQASQGHQHTAIVTQEPSESLRGRGRLEIPLGKPTAMVRPSRGERLRVVSNNATPGSSELAW